jgi:serine/threonine protein kinase
MSARSGATNTELPLGVLDRIDQICDRFEGGWQSGLRPRVEDHIGEIAEAYRGALLCELLAVELDARRRRGERPTPAEYEARCPEHAELILNLFAAAELSKPLHHRQFGEPTDRSSATEAKDEPGCDGVGENPPRLSGFRIERELGRGGMGIVYRAYDEKRRAMVALKTVRHVDAAAVLRLKREFRALADLSHPNLVALHELTSDGSSWFFTMELVDGVDFLTFVRSGADRPIEETSETLGLPGCSSIGAGMVDTEVLQGANRPERMPEPGGVRPTAQPELGLGLSPAAQGRLRTALKALAEGVAFLHGAGRLHRDLKPSNVLVTRQGRVVVLDLGLAAELGSSGLYESSVHHVVGTASYMAPEQAAGQPVSPASDWYSLGSILYEALTGQPPFVGGPLQVLLDKQSFEPSAPCERAPGLPDDLNALCVDLLRRDPEARPTGRDVLDRLGATPGESHLDVPALQSPPRVVPFVGRARDLACLEAAFADVCRGQTVAFYVHGPSGVGKSALIRRFVEDRVRRDQALVLVGRCYEQESVPYKALDSVIDALARYLKHLPLLKAQALLPRDIRSLVRVFPTLGEAKAVATAPGLAALVPDPQELRRRAFQALRDLLGRLSDLRPLVMAIDDLQWGDADSAVLLSELLRPPDAPRFLLLGGYRSEDAATSPLLRALLEAHAGGGPSVDRRVLALSALEPEAALELAMDLLDHEGPHVHAHAVAIVRESRGNPFFVTELVQHVRADPGVLGHVPHANDVALDEVLWSRIERLPEEARRLLEVVAVSGRPLGEAEASRAAVLGEGERALFTLLRSGRLIRTTGPAEREIETYHDRVREVVAAHVPPTSLKLYHRRLALALELSGRADPEVLAFHFEGASELERARKYFAEAAAQAAQTLAFERAAKLYRQALALEPRGDDNAHQLWSGLGDALANSGRGPEAARAYLTAADGATTALALDLRRRAALQYLICGHLDEGLAELIAVLKAVGMAYQRTPLRAVISLIMRRLTLRLRGLGFREREQGEVSVADLSRIDVCWTSAIGLGIIDPIRGADFTGRHLLMALAAGEPYRIARGLLFEAVHVGSAGGPAERRVAPLLRMSEELAQRLDDPYTWGGLCMTRGVAAYMTGSWIRAGEFLDQAETIFRTRCTGVTWERDSATIFSLWSLQFRGELAELGRRWPVVLKDATERMDRHMVTNLSTFLMATLRLAADDPEGAQTALGQALGDWTRKGFHIQHNEWFGAAVQIKLYRGDGADAWKFLTKEYMPALARSHLLRVQKIKIFFYERRARCALAAAAVAARPGPLLKSAELDAKRLDGEGMAWSRALAYPIRASIAAARGDRSGAARLFAAAVTHLEAIDMNLHAAASRRRLGELLEGPEGLAHVESADSWMRQQNIQDPARMADLFAARVH